MMRMDGAPILLASDLTATLTPTERQEFLKEDETTALIVYQQRERTHGRSGAWPP